MWADRDDQPGLHAIARRVDPAGSSRRFEVSMFPDMELFDVAMILGALIKWLIYTALLWVMIKVQKLNYNVLGLFGSSLLTILVSLIPIVGSYLCYVVLVICLWKCTGAEIVPDVVFTVGIAGALMFCVNLWVIGMLMGSLRRPDVAERKGEGTGKSAAAEDGDDGDAEPQPDEPRTGGKAARPVAARTVSTAIRPSTTPGVTNSPFTIKGTSLGGAHPSVLISDGSQVYTIRSGESFMANFAQGRSRFRCDTITKSNVVLRNGEGTTFQLPLP